jgi:hypothetical protein
MELISESNEWDKNLFQFVICGSLDFSILCLDSDVVGMHTDTDV